MKKGDKIITRREFFRKTIEEPLVRTAVEAPIVCAGGIVARQLISRAFMSREEIRGMNKAIREDWQNKSTRDKLVRQLDGSIAAPLIEETLFRILPSKIIDLFPEKKGKICWEAGIPISALFGFIHYPHALIPEPYKKKYIPATEFLLGCYYWYIMRERGAKAAVEGHSLLNLFYHAFLEGTSR